MHTSRRGVFQRPLGSGGVRPRASSTPRWTPLGLPFPRPNLVPSLPVTSGAGLLNRTPVRPRIPPPPSAVMSAPQPDRRAQPRRPRPTPSTISRTRRFRPSYPPAVPTPSSCLQPLTFSLRSRTPTLTPATPVGPLPVPVAAAQAGRRPHPDRRTRTPTQPRPGQLPRFMQMTPRHARQNSGVVMLRKRPGPGGAELGPPVCPSAPRLRRRVRHVRRPGFVNDVEEDSAEEEEGMRPVAFSGGDSWGDELDGLDEEMDDDVGAGPTGGSTGRDFLSRRLFKPTVRSQTGFLAPSEEMPPPPPRRPQRKKKRLQVPIYNGGPAVPRASAIAMENRRLMSLFARGVNQKRGRGMFRSSFDGMPPDLPVSKRRKL